MNIKTSFALAMMAIAGLAPLTEPARAQQSGPPSTTASPHRLRDKFAVANTTHDGRLTLAQAEAGSLPMVAHNFDAIDAGHRGYVSMDDIRAFVHARRAARQGQAPSTTQEP